MRLAQGVDVVHFIPGRVRLKVQQAKGNAPFARTIEQRLGALPGIRRIEVHPVTGSVLVSYDASALGKGDAAQRLIDALSELFPGADVGRLRGWLGG